MSRRVKAAEDVDDVLQETLLRIHRQLGEVCGRDKLTAWVFQVARNAIADHYRRLHRRRRADRGSGPPRKR